MNKNIFKTIILCLCISLQSCAQNKNEQKNKNTQMKEIQYQQEGMLFQLEYQHSNCSYEILVNNMPVIAHFGKGERSGLTIDINQYILKSGKQEVTIRMFPAKKDQNSFFQSLDLNSYTKILISKQKRNADLNKIGKK